jgi:hypothetical protein
MFKQELYTHIKNNMSSWGIESDIVYGNAEGYTAPYIVLNTIDDPEMKVLLCDDQGDAGVFSCQFTAFIDKDITSTLMFMEPFKNKIQELRGVIGNTTQYRIDYNRTSGVKEITAGDMARWVVFFESILTWSKV